MSRRPLHLRLSLVRDSRRSTYGRLSALKLANGLFVIPLMMAYSPLLLTPDQGWPVVLLAGAVTLLLIVVLAMALEGFCGQRCPLICALPRYLRWVVSMAYHIGTPGWGRTGAVVVCCESLHARRQN